jgi:hypothetical protein
MLLADCGFPFGPVDFDRIFFFFAWQPFRLTLTKATRRRLVYSCMAGGPAETIRPRSLVLRSSGEIFACLPACAVDNPRFVSFQLAYK